MSGELGAFSPLVGYTRRKTDETEGFMPRKPIDEDSPFETDDRFPTGPWIGYFLQPGFGSRFEMQLALQFQTGRMTGEGEDYVGPFLIRGRYDTEDGKCVWTKQYVGRHAVFYEGYNEGRGIWGMWDIPQIWKGGFHIWPEGMADPTTQREAQSQQRPAGVSFEDSNAPAELEPAGWSSVSEQNP